MLVHQPLRVVALMLIALLLAAGFAHAQQNAAQSNRVNYLPYTPPAIDEAAVFGPAPGKKIKLFILSGQSNMVGHGVSGELAVEQVKPDARILMFEEGKWQPLRPLKKSFGPELSFAWAMAKQWPDETIGIVKQSVGGTGVLAWHPQWTAERADLTADAKKGNLWKALTEKVAAARAAADCEVMGFVWQQGGADMKRANTGAMYLEHFTALVEGLRKETSSPTLPVVLGSYRDGGLPDNPAHIPKAMLESRTASRPGALMVLQAQYDAQEALTPCKMVALRDIERHPKNVHYNTKGQLELGRVFARGYLELTQP